MVSQMDYSIIYRRLLQPFVSLAWTLVSISLVVFLAFVVYLALKYRVNLFRLNARTLLRLKRMHIGFKPLDFLRWFFLDSLYAKRGAQEFREFGLTLYCGRQGSGKTMSMIHYANGIRQRYPECIIVSNFQYRYADLRMESWRDFFEIRNGTKGVLFLIDEIHSEYSTVDWKDFPENLLSEISQQRKQRMKICATSQIYSRVVKQLREQTFSVVQCSTFGRRWTFNREYDARDYELFCDSPNRKRLRPMWKGSFVQDDRIRRDYDTYEKIERLADRDFIPRNERE